MTTKSWRSILPIHPAAELFPRMGDEELAVLAEDIKANGLLSPVVFWEPESKTPPRYVLEGVNRLDAMERAGLLSLTDRGEPTFGGFPWRYEIKSEYRPLNQSEFRRIKKGEHVERTPGTDPYAFVMSANLRRRHLTAEQKREVIAKLMKAQPEKSDRQIAETVKASPTTVGTVRADMEAAGELSKLDSRVGADGKTRKQPARKTTRKPTPAPAANSGAAEFQPVMRLTDSSTQTASNTSQDRDDIGADSASECARLRARVEEQDDQIYQLKHSNNALRSMVEEAYPGLHDKLDPLMETLFEQGIATMATQAPVVVRDTVHKFEKLLVEHGLMRRTPRSDDPKGYAARLRFKQRKQADAAALGNTPKIDAAPVAESAAPPPESGDLWRATS